MKIKHTSMWSMMNSMEIQWKLNGINIHNVSKKPTTMTKTARQIRPMYLRLFAFN